MKSGKEIHKGTNLWTIWFKNVYGKKLNEELNSWCFMVVELWVGVFFFFFRICFNVALLFS